MNPAIKMTTKSRLLSKPSVAHRTYPLSSVSIVHRLFDRVRVVSSSITCRNRVRLMSPLFPLFHHNMRPMTPMLGFSMSNQSLTSTERSITERAFHFAVATNGQLKETVNSKKYYYYYYYYWTSILHYYRTLIIPDVFRTINLSQINLFSILSFYYNDESIVTFS